MRAFSRVNFSSKARNWSPCRELRAASSRWCRSAMVARALSSCWSTCLELDTSLLYRSLPVLTNNLILMFVFLSRRAIRFLLRRRCSRKWNCLNNLLLNAAIVCVADVALECLGRTRIEWMKAARVYGDTVTCQGECVFKSVMFGSTQIVRAKEKERLKRKHSKTKKQRDRMSMK